MPCTPTASSASRTSSSLNGLMIAMTSFMGVSLGRFLGAWSQASGGLCGRVLHRAEDMNGASAAPFDQVPRDGAPSDFVLAVPNILRFAATSHGGACAYSHRRNLYDSLTGAKMIYLVHSCAATYCSRSKMSRLRCARSTS